MRYLMLPGRIKTLSSIYTKTRKLGGLYKKYTAREWEPKLRSHLRNVAHLL